MRVEPDRFRADIEGLRAIAVLLVLAYHAGIGPFGGGYLGVDVFFVVSGFLITTLLLRELDHTGFIGLARFWGRRARRLLPASCLVIVATLLAGAVVLDPLARNELARDALASATFVVNIVFAHRQSDYLTADLAPSPLLHFWSLALEEQFYLLWPILLQVVAGYRRHSRAVVAGLVLVLWPISLFACVRLTSSNQPWAFFSLPTRAWELLTGAGLAVLGAAVLRVPSILRAMAGWAGLIAIVVTAVVYSTDTASFPGPAALVPVLATAFVIVAGPTALGGPAMILRRPTLTWIGQRSYSIYLWHWPALVLMEVRFGPLTAWQRVGVLLAAVGVAAVTFAVLEDPVRHSRWLAARARRSLALGGALITTGVAASLIVVATAPALVGAGAAAAPVVLDTTATTSGGGPGPTVPPATTAAAGGAPAPSATLPVTQPPAPSTTAPRPGPAELAAANLPQIEASLQTARVPVNVRPALRSARGDLPAIYHDGCHLDAAVTTPGSCTFGDPSSRTTVVLFGDSHAAQWFPAFDALAQQHGWRLIVLTKKGCPTAHISVFSPMVNRELRECDAWRTAVTERLTAEHPALIVMSSYRYRQTGEWAGVEANEAWRRGLTATLASLRPLATNVLVLGDTPTPHEDVPSCVASHLGNVANCVTARSQAVRDDRLAVEREVATAHGALFVPTSDWLCSAAACPVIVGDVLVYRDANHLTATAAAWLAPYVDAAITPLLASAPAPPPTTTTTAPPPPAPCAVSFVGDSMGAGTLNSGLGPALAGVGCNLVWSAAYGGLASAVGASLLARAGATPSNVALVMLGFHKAYDEVHGGRFPGRIEAVMAAAGPRLVVWVMLGPTPECSTGYKAALVRANQELSAAQARWPNLVLVDYPSVIAAHPEFSEHRCPHLVSAGYQATASWLAAEVRRVVEQAR